MYKLIPAPALFTYGIQLSAASIKQAVQQSYTMALGAALSAVHSSIVGTVAIEQKTIQTVTVDVPMARQVVLISTPGATTIYMYICMCSAFACAVRVLSVSS